MLGNKTPIYYIFWKFFPLASSFRIAGRISIIIPPIILLILIWIFHPKNKILHKNIKYVLVICSVFSIISILLKNIFDFKYTTCSPISLRNIPSFIIITLEILLIISPIIITLITKYKSLKFIIALLILSQLTITLYLGTWIEKKKDFPTFKDILSSRKVKQGFNKYPGYGLYTKNAISQINQHFFSPYLAKNYNKCINAANEKESFHVLTSIRKPKEAVIISDNKLPTSNEENLNSSIRLLYNSNNKIIFSSTTSDPSIFVLSYPFDKNWNVKVNNKIHSIFKANGNQIGIVIPRGTSLIEFFYWSHSIAIGLIISLVSFFIIFLLSFYYIFVNIEY